MLLYHLNCTHYAFRGGASSNDVDCGAFCVVASNTASGTYWNIGAALE